MRVLVALAALVALAGSTLPLARTAVAAPADVTLRMVSQPLRVEPDGVGVFRLRVAGNVPVGATIVIAAREQIETRGEVRQAIDGEFSASQPDQVELELDSVPVEDGNLVITLPTEVETRLPEQLRLRFAGLYPLTFEVRVDDRPLALLTTFIERLDEPTPPPPHPVVVAVTVGIDAPPTLQPDGSTRVLETTRAELDRLIEALELNTAVPITATLRPEVMEGLARSGFAADQARLDRLRAVFADHHELLPTTYVALDPTQSVAGDLGVEFSEQLIRGEDVLRETLGTTTDRGAWMLDAPIDGGALDMLRLLGMHQLLINGGVRGDLPDQDGALGTVRTTTGTVMPALSTDLVVQARLTTPPADPVLAAYHIMAELEAMSLEAENVAEENDGDPRPVGVLIDAGSLDDVDSTLLATLLSLLDESPRIQVMAANAALEELDGATPGAARDRVVLRDPPGDGPDDTAGTLTRLRLAVTSTSSMLPDTDLRPQRWNAVTRVVPAANLTEAQRDEYVRQLDGELGEVRGSVTVVTSGRVSLGGRTSLVPITLINAATEPRTVRVRLNSPKLDLEEPDQIVTVIDRAQVDIPVRARTNGVFPVTVELLTPAGDPPASVSAPTTFTVQATALTGMGQFISGALILVLATWWIQHWLSRRRAGRAEEAAQHLDHHPSGIAGSR